MRSYVGLSVCLALLQVVVYGKYSPRNFNGSTPDLEAIIKGRCHQYQELHLDNGDPELEVIVDCDELWKTFTKPFINKDPCKVNFTGAYKDTFKLIDNKQFYTDKVQLYYFIVKLPTDSY